MSTNYKIQCYIETLSSDNKITLRGCEGYRLQKEDKKYLVFFEDSPNAINCKLFNESDEFMIAQPNANIQDMLLAAQIHHKKVELEFNLKTKSKTYEITKVKLFQ